MDDRITELADLFQEAGHAHHQAYIETNGADDDWAIWYADYLIGSLSDLLDASLTRTQIIVLLVELDRLHRTIVPGSNWSVFYARELVKRYF